jgi:hypothetical protein
MLDQATVQDLKRLMELYPISNLRAAFPTMKGTKDEICTAIAEERRYAEITAFLDDHFSCCKQHVHIFTYGGGANTLPDLAEAVKIFGLAGDHALYIARVQYGVVLRDPLEETTLEFLWPIRIEMTPTHLIVRFVVLEKNLSSYFDRPSYLQSRSIEEKTILRNVEGLNAKPADLHKGIKALWGEGFMDSIRAKYKKPISMAQEVMDEERGIREYNPELYGTLQEVPLLNMLFVIAEEEGCSVSAFLADPGRGYLAFPRYSEKKGDTDCVVQRILERNQ